MRVRVPEPLLRRAIDAVRDMSTFFRENFAKREMTGGGPSSEEVEWVRSVRAVRDLLMAAPRTKPIAIELSKADARLVVTAAVFAMEDLADSMQQPGTTLEEWGHFETSMRGLYAVTLEFAFENVKVKERPGRTRPIPQELRRVIECIDNKVRTGNPQPMPPFKQPSAMPDRADSTGIVREDSLHSQWLGGGVEASRNLMPSFGVGEHRVPGIEAGACVDFDDVEVEPTNVIAAGLGAAPDEGLVIHARLFREPRLQKLVDDDRRGLNTALSGDDNRLAAIMLSSLVESLLLDVAIWRRDEFELAGTPDKWDLRVVLQLLVRENGLDEDRSALAYALGCRRILRPTSQLVAPLAVSEDMIKSMLEAVQRFVIATGFSSDS